MSLDRELRAVGIPARRRLRILAELDDHLACDPSADMGEPRRLAAQFADELGTVYARRAGYAVFLALAPVGLLFGALALLSRSAINPGTVLGTQLAFVGGTLALLRARRLGTSAADARFVRRRVALGVAGGVLTLASIGAATQRPLALVTVALGAVTLATATLAAVRSSRVPPVTAGAAGDFSVDLGLSVSPWALARWIAGFVAVCIAVAGVVNADPFDGLLRAALDAGLCLLCFRLLGRWLGLLATA